MNQQTTCVSPLISEKFFFFKVNLNIYILETQGRSRLRRLSWNSEWSLGAEAVALSLPPAPRLTRLTSQECCGSSIKNGRLPSRLLTSASECW